MPQQHTENLWTEVNRLRQKILPPQSPPQYDLPPRRSFVLSPSPQPCFASMLARNDQTERETLTSSLPRAGTSVETTEQPHLSYSEVQPTTVGGCRLTGGRGLEQGGSIISLRAIVGETPRLLPNCHRADGLTTQRGGDGKATTQTILPWWIGLGRYLVLLESCPHHRSPTVAVTMFSLFSFCGGPVVIVVTEKALCLSVVTADEKCLMRFSWRGRTRRANPIDEEQLPDIKLIKSSFPLIHRRNIII